MTHQEAVDRFEDLVTQYGHVIRAAVRSVLGREAERLGADVEQQVLLELWKQVRREQIIDFPSSYLYRASIRETIRLVRKVEKRSEEALDEVPLPDPRAESHPERRALSSELSRRLRKITGKFSEERRAAIVAHLAGFRVQEIMESRDWSYNRARNLIARGMADLRQALEDEDES
ncbi:MAG: sigma-70 family RNA polymerase sigma factor [Deltaproteobacteria bacterium]|nr:sigma-70 family RNA polymerase sigma factor [Deltaproteobacteria bacterium]